jgi:coenzyme F420-dependent glucose-6-phosphate dehydrogenase
MQKRIKKLEKYVGLGFTEIVLTNSSPDREQLLKLIAEEIAPALK